MKRILIGALTLLSAGLVSSCGEGDSPTASATQAGPVLASEGRGGGGGLDFRFPSAIDVTVTSFPPSFAGPGGTVTLPIFRGSANGEPVWYVLTESSNEDVAERRGINAAPKLANALGTAAVQRAKVVGGEVQFAGTVDFRPERVVVPGPQGFPPAQARPGARGDAAYSPLFTTDGRTVFNGSHVANRTGLHDSVVDIDFAARRVTLSMFAGFYDDDHILYLHVDASDPVLAALEGSNFAPNLNAAPGIASNDKDRSARSAIIPVVNGPRGVNDPQRQGLQSALLGQGDPLNVTQEEPEDNEYTPVWDVHVAVWTDAAIRNGQRNRLTSADEIADAVEEGLVVSLGTGPRNPELGGLRAADMISNCPIMTVGKFHDFDANDRDADDRDRDDDVAQDGRDS